jgi:hypothetical protein
MPFLAATCWHEELTLEVVTSDKVEDYIRRRKAQGCTTSTLQQMRPRLRRLVRARSRQEIRRCGTRTWPRVSPFDPYSDEDLDAIQRAPLSADQRRAVDVAIALTERLGLPRHLVGQARLVGDQLEVADRVIAILKPDDPLRCHLAAGEQLLNQDDLATAREAIEKQTGIALQLSRLRHRYLQRVISLRGVSLAELMLVFGVGRDDIELLIPVVALSESELTRDLLVRYLTGDVGE